MARLLTLITFRLPLSRGSYRESALALTSVASAIRGVLECIPIPAWAEFREVPRASRITHLHEHCHSVASTLLFWNGLVAQLHQICVQDK